MRSEPSIEESQTLWNKVWGARRALLLLQEQSAKIYYQRYYQVCLQIVWQLLSSDYERAQQGIGNWLAVLVSSSNKVSALKPVVELFQKIDTQSLPQGQPLWTETESAYFRPGLMYFKEWSWQYYQAAYHDLSRWHRWRYGNKGLSVERAAALIERHDLRRGPVWWRRLLGWLQDIDRHRQVVSRYRLYQQLSAMVVQENCVTVTAGDDLCEAVSLVQQTSGHSKMVKELYQFSKALSISAHDQAMQESAQEKRNNMSLQEQRKACETFLIDYSRDELQKLLRTVSSEEIAQSFEKLRSTLLQRIKFQTRRLRREQIRSETDAIAVASSTIPECDTNDLLSYGYFTTELLEWFIFIENELLPLLVSLRGLMSSAIDTARLTESYQAFYTQYQKQRSDFVKLLEKRSERADLKTLQDEIYREFDASVQALEKQFQTIQTCCEQLLVTELAAKREQKQSEISQALSAKVHQLSRKRALKKVDIAKEQLKGFAFTGATDIVRFLQVINPTSEALQQEQALWQDYDERLTCSAPVWQQFIADMKQWQEDLTRWSEEYGVYIRRLSRLRYLPITDRDNDPTKVIEQLTVAWELFYPVEQAFAELGGVVRERWWMEKGYGGKTAAEYEETKDRWLTYFGDKQPSLAFIQNPQGQWVMVNRSASGEVLERLLSGTSSETKQLIALLNQEFFRNLSRPSLDCYSFGIALSQELGLDAFRWRGQSDEILPGIAQAMQDVMRAVFERSYLPLWQRLAEQERRLNTSRQKLYCWLMRKRRGLDQRPSGDKTYLMIRESDPYWLCWSLLVRMQCQAKLPDLPLEDPIPAPEIPAESFTSEDDFEREWALDLKHLSPIMFQAEYLANRFQVFHLELLRVIGKQRCVNLREWCLAVQNDQQLKATWLALKKDYLRWQSQGGHPDAFNRKIYQLGYTEEQKAYRLVRPKPDEPDEYELHRRAHRYWTLKNGVVRMYQYDKEFMEDVNILGYLIVREYLFDMRGGLGEGRKYAVNGYIMQANRRDLCNMPEFHREFLTVEHDILESRKACALAKEKNKAFEEEAKVSKEKAKALKEKAKAFEEKARTLEEQAKLDKVEIAKLRAALAEKKATATEADDSSSASTSPAPLTLTGHGSLFDPGKQLAAAEPRGNDNLEDGVVCDAVNNDSDDDTDRENDAKRSAAVGVRQ